MVTPCPTLTMPATFGSVTSNSERSNVMTPLTWARLCRSTIVIGIAAA